MATFNKFNIFTENLVNGVHNFGSDTIKIMLTNTAPVATNTQYSNLVDLSTGGGYTVGGLACTVTVGTSGGVCTVTGASVQWTGSGSGFGPFRYVAIYDSTAAGSPLIGWADYGSALTILSGETFTVSFSGSDLFTVT